MGMTVARRFCTHCGDYRPFEKHGLNWVLHVILSVLTLGLWILVVVVLLIIQAFVPMRCRECGKAKLL